MHAQRAEVSRSWTGTSPGAGGVAGADRRRGRDRAGAGNAGAGQPGPIRDAPRCRVAPLKARRSRGAGEPRATTPVQLSAAITPRAISSPNAATNRDVYAIPYEGEEVKLHWANKDQYYIKTSEYLRDNDHPQRRKAVGHPVRVHFHLTDAARANTAPPRPPGPRSSISTWRTSEHAGATHR